VRAASGRDFLSRHLIAALGLLLASLERAFPSVFVIMGNDDARSEEGALQAADARGLLHYVHGRTVSCGAYDVYGYAYVPPTPFHLMTERYDVSATSSRAACRRRRAGARFPPMRAAATSDHQKTSPSAGTARRLRRVLFHTPPCGPLDRAALDGLTVDRARWTCMSAAWPCGVHREPAALLTLYGHP
jgi:hypothetical protein